MADAESMDCPHCGKEISLPLVDEEGVILKKLKRPVFTKLGGSMAH